MGDDQVILAAVSQLPRWQVLHWGGGQDNSLLRIEVAGAEQIVSVNSTYAVLAGRRVDVTAGSLLGFLQGVQRDLDTAALSTSQAQQAQDWLLAQWRRCFDDDYVGRWDFPDGGFLRWTGSDDVLHLEASDGGPYNQPLPEPLRGVLVDLGWSAPDHRFRNCWLEATRDRHRAAAALGVLTPLAAFGLSSPPPLRLT